MHYSYTLTYVILFIGLMGFGAMLAQNDERNDAERYCAMVHKKEWPDYDKTYRAMCDGSKLKSTQL